MKIRPILLACLSSLYGSYDILEQVQSLKPLGLSRMSEHALHSNRSVLVQTRPDGAGQCSGVKPQLQKKAAFWIVKSDEGEAAKRHRLAIV